MNQIGTIKPYWANDTWVFDDPARGLLQEPFVAGMPEMIDDLVSGIPDARNGFRLLFSASPFPGFQRRLVWIMEEYDGNWYRDATSGQSNSLYGWLCPALFKYFDKAPKEIWVKAEPIDNDS